MSPDPASLPVLNDASKPGLSTQATWLFAAKVFSFGLTVVVPMVLVRILSRHDYGLFRQGSLFLNTALTVLMFNYQFSAFYYFPQGPERRLAAAWNTVVFQTGAGVLALAILAARPELVALLLGSGELTRFAPLFGVILLFSCFGTLLEYFATADQDVKWSTVFIATAQLTRGGFLVITAVLAPGIGYLFAAVLAQAVLQGVIFTFYLRTHFAGCWKSFNRSFFREQFLFVAPMAASGLLWMAQTQIHSYVVSHQFTPSQFAVYAIGCFQIPFTGLVRESLGAVLIPRISELKTRNAYGEIRGLIVSASKVLALVSCGVAGACLAFGPDLFRFLFSERYLESWPIFAVNLAQLIMEIPATDAVSRSFPAVQRLMLWVRPFTIAGSTGAMIVLGPRFGLVFIISVTMAALFFEKVIVCLASVRATGFTRKDLRSWHPVAMILGIAASASLAAGLLRQAAGAQPLVIRLIVAGTAFTVLYLPLVWRGGLFSKAEKERVLKPVLRPGGRRRG